MVLLKLERGGEFGIRQLLSTARPLFGGGEIASERIFEQTLER
jgi:hypothetical protein